MGSPPPNNTSQTREMAISAPLLGSSQAERDAFDNNFTSYVAFMQAFRNAWKDVLGDTRASAVESDVYAENDGVEEGLENIANPAEFTARRTSFQNDIMAILTAALNNGKLTNPIVAVPRLGGQTPSTKSR